MSISNYSVLLGMKAGYHRDQPNNFGKFFHGHIDVQTPGQLYNTAIDVDTERPGVHVLWRVVHLRAAEWENIFQLSDGLHALASNSTSGAVDYIRDPRLHSYVFIPEYVVGPIPWWRWPLEVFRRAGEEIRALQGSSRVSSRDAASPVQAKLMMSGQGFRVVDLTPGWKTGTDVEALTDLEAMLVDAARVVIFGAAYPAQNGRPPGLHDIHQNQGDPPDSPFARLDAIWQDGLTIAIHSDGTASAFMNRFSTQGDRTDDLGHPI